MSEDLDKMDKQISLLELLENKDSIIIPIIQRDYAQGRKKENFILESFLKEIKNVIENDDTKLNLDFIYGKTMRGKFYPFDGQQRLTTLWLVLWYLNFKFKSNLNEKLRKFSYETRISAREFCEKICSLENPEKGCMDIGTYIKDQTWFFSEWEQDPTIQAILYALVKIEEIFKDIKNGNWLKNFKNITFFNLNIDSNNLPLRDDLYIKMNARGKPLSDFENFKADLLKFYVANANEEEWKKLAICLDKTWTDIFWQNRVDYKGNKIIDEIYFEFINRYVLNKLLLLERNPSDNELCKLGYKTDNGNDIDLRYETFEIYNYKNVATETVSALESILDNSKIEKIKSFYSNPNIPEWRKISFIPEYHENSNRVKAISQSGRIIFFAICKYLENVKEFEEEKFKDWLYFASNMVGDGIENLKEMKSAINRIDAFSGYCGNIIEHLSSLDAYEITGGHNQDQLKEEIKKAKRIRAFSEEKTKIRQAEDHDFARGSIRYLFHDEAGNEAWDCFDSKFGNLNKYFSNWNEVSKERIKFLKIIISYCSIDNIRDRYIFEDNRIVFRRAFLDDKLKEPIHHVLEDKKKKYIKREDDEIIYYLVNSNILDKIAEDENIKEILKKKSDPSIYMRYYYGKPLLLYPCRYPKYGIVLDRENRDNMLKKCGLKQFAASDDSSDRYFYQGVEIVFKYDDKTYICCDLENHECKGREDFIKESCREYEGSAT